MPQVRGSLSETSSRPCDRAGSSGTSPLEHRPGPISDRNRCLDRLPLNQAPRRSAPVRQADLSDTGQTAVRPAARRILDNRALTRRSVFRLAICWPTADRPSQRPAQRKVPAPARRCCSACASMSRCSSFTTRLPTGGSRGRNRCAALLALIAETVSWPSMQTLARFLRLPCHAGEV